MTADWHQYLTIAETLLHHPLPDIPVEMQFRLIISRAYYAAFHAARLHLEAYYRQRWNHDRGSHDQVIDLYNRPHHKGYLFVWSQLRRLKRERVIADYTDEAAVRWHDANAAVELATRTINAIAALP